MKARTLDDEKVTLKIDYARWMDVWRHGTSDPSWPDGVNLNLIASQIRADQMRIFGICAQTGSPVPRIALCFIPQPVDGDYMAPGSKAGKFYWEGRTHAINQEIRREHAFEGAETSSGAIVQKRAPVARPGRGKSLRSQARAPRGKQKRPVVA